MRIFILLGILIWAHCASAQLEYDVVRTSKNVNVDGSSQDAAWEQAIELTSFKNYWSDEQMPATSFRGLYDDDFFYFLYVVVDKDIVLVDNAELGEEGQAVGSDRIEIFIRQKDESKPYYSLEMDAKARIFDSKATFDKRLGIDREWDWPEGQIELKSSFTDDGYIVEGKISMYSLNELNLIDGNKIYAGLYRGNYNSKEGTKPSIDWISWVKPKKLSFHIPSSFGVLNLKK